MWYTIIIEPLKGMPEVTKVQFRAENCSAVYCNLPSTAILSPIPKFTGFYKSMLQQA